MIRSGTLLLILASLLVRGNALAQIPERLSERVITSETATATCFDKTNQKQIGSMLVRSEQCVNTAKLFVKGPSDKGFRLVYLEEPSRYELFNNVKIVDWSPDNHHLLAELFVGQWGSDAGGNAPLLYDATDGVFASPNVVATALNIRFGHDCEFVVQTMGFAADGGVVFKIWPRFGEGKTAAEPGSCVNKEGLWLLKDGISPLADTYRVQRYGRFLAIR
ncbi:MAG: hypothetical protein DMG49_05780 [Acidobacteria bacterium]|nr:MAG: hypothetical protein DMG49_05780 [Acidobacteriota bacterium]